MGILSGILGNASEVDIEKIEEEFEQLLVEEEQIETAYKVIRDLFIFTDKRLILVDKQGVTGKKVEYHSFPYRSITHFSIESAGHFDLDAELKLWISKADTPLTKQFKKSKNVYDVQRSLAEHVLK